MAEVLIKNFNFNYVDHIVVFNKDIRNKVESIIKKNNIQSPPKLEYGYVDGKYFFFTKFFFEGRENEDLVTGPKELKEIYSTSTLETISKRKKTDKFNYKTINDLLEAIYLNFDCIPELAGIHNLETLNEIHTNTVSDHTLEVVKNLHNNSEYKKLESRLQEILTLSAYLHDIGKGPKSKWRDGKQKAYNDHPYDSLIYTQRILIEDIEELTDNEIRLINFLVTYHDILGDLANDHRNTIELKNIIKSHEDLELLYILSQADILSLNKDWFKNLCGKFGEIKKKVLND
jgi:hypothetical protein